MLNPDYTYWFCDVETTGLLNADVPIEVGLIVCDSHLQQLETYESLITWPFFHKKDDWEGSEQDAYRIHRIPLLDVKMYGEPRYVVADFIHDMTRRHMGRRILISDNIQFEWRHMQRILHSPPAIWPFHYCGWDTSLLLELTGVGDPKPVHRALPDAQLVLDAVREAYKCASLTTSG